MAAPLALAALSPQAVTAISTLGLAAALSLGLITQQQFNKIEGSLITSAGEGTDDIIRPGTDKWNKAFGTSKPDITTPEGYKFKWQGGEYKQLRQPGQPSFANYDKYLDLKQTENTARNIATGKASPSILGGDSFQKRYDDVFSAAPAAAPKTTPRAAPLASGDVDTTGDVFSDDGDAWTPPKVNAPRGAGVPAAAGEGYKDNELPALDPNAGAYRDSQGKFTAKPPITEAGTRLRGSSVGAGEATHAPEALAQARAGDYPRVVTVPTGSPESNAFSEYAAAGIYTATRKADGTTTYVISPKGAIANERRRVAPAPNVPVDITDAQRRGGRDDTQYPPAPAIAPSPVTPAVPGRTDAFSVGQPAPRATTAAGTPPVITEAQRRGGRDDTVYPRAAAIAPSPVTPPVPGTTDAFSIGQPAPAVVQPTTRPVITPAQRQGGRDSTVYPRAAAIPTSPITAPVPGQTTALSIGQPVPPVRQPEGPLPTVTAAQRQGGNSSVQYPAVDTAPGSYNRDGTPYVAPASVANQQVPFHSRTVLPIVDEQNGVRTQTSYGDIIARIQNAPDLASLNSILSSAGGLDGAPQAVVQAYTKALEGFTPTETGKSDAGVFLTAQAQGIPTEWDTPAPAQPDINTGEEGAALGQQPDINVGADTIPAPTSIPTEWDVPAAAAPAGTRPDDTPVPPGAVPVPGGVAAPGSVPGAVPGAEGAAQGQGTINASNIAEGAPSTSGVAEGSGYGQPLPPGENEQIIPGESLSEQFQRKEDERAAQQAQIESNISEALNRGHKPDAIMAQLQTIANRTADDEIRANLMAAGFKMLQDSTNELNKGIGQAGMRNQSYNMQTSFGKHLGDSITANVAAQRYYNERADEANQLAAQRQVALDEQKDKRAGFLRDPRVGERIKMTDPETGQEINLSAIRESNPDLYDRTIRFLANASPGEIGGLMEASGMTGLPHQFFTGEELPAPPAPDWSNPLVSGAANKVEFLNGLPSDLTGAYAGMSWHDIKTETGKGRTWNQYLGSGNGDERRWIPATSSGEGVVRFAVPVNSLLGSDLIHNTVSILYDKNGEQLDLDRINAALSQLPATKQRQAKLGMALLNLYQAGTITGTAGVENLANYFNNITGLGALASEDALLAGIEQSLDANANQAYISLPRGVKMTPELAFIKKNGAKAYINAVLSTEGAGDGRVYQDLDGSWFDSNGNTIELR